MKTSVRIRVTALLFLLCGSMVQGARQSQRKISYSSYILTVLRQVHHNIGITSNAMSYMNSIVNDLFDRIATEAASLASDSDNGTLTSRDIQTAVRVVFPSRLARDAISEGTKAITQQIVVQFPVLRIQQHLTERYKEATHKSAVYMAAVLEYITTTVLTLTGNVAIDENNVRITIRHLEKAIVNDEELNTLLGGKL